MYDNFLYNLLLNLFLNVSSGVVTGWVVSEAYWLRRIKVDRPRLYLESKSWDEEKMFELYNHPWNIEHEEFFLKNKGLTRALDIVVEGDNFSKRIDSLEPGEEYFIVNLDFESKIFLKISYKDMFDKVYLEKWSVRGPHGELDKWSDGSVGGTIMFGDSVKI